MHVSLFVQNHFLLLSATGRRPPRDASVRHPDRPAVWTPGGPSPNQGGLSQCLCRTARYLGKAGARVLLGACLLGAKSDLSPVCILPERTLQPTHPKSCTGSLLLSWYPFSPPPEKARWHSLGVCWTPPMWLMQGWSASRKLRHHRERMMSEELLPGAMQQFDSSLGPRPLKKPRFTVTSSSRMYPGLVLIY